ncbi:hypothetical protein ERJ75_000643800 [Trypanosoma vivax]|nr:hypothetical protein ERJ75_000643800 [Trypanosoma vivax]
MRKKENGKDAINEEVARGDRMDIKRTVPVGKGVATPIPTTELTKLEVAVQDHKNRRRRHALIPWRRKVLADKAIGDWKEDEAKLSVTHSASWNLAKSMYAPRPLTQPVLVVDGHPLTEHRQAQALTNMHKARPTKQTHATGMKTPGTRDAHSYPSPG